MRAHLIPLNTKYPPIQIIRDVTLVGRQEDLCDIFLPEVSVSKIHCLIVRTDGLLFIRDLGSTNGTKVNGRRGVRYCPVMSWRLPGKNFVWKWGLENRIFPRLSFKSFRPKLSIPLNLARVI